MKNFKDITISIFAIIGFVAILSSFNNQSEPQAPDLHVWKIYGNNGGQYTSTYAFMYNKVTGEVRKLDTNPLEYDEKKGELSDPSDLMYATMKEEK